MISGLEGYKVSGISALEDSGAHGSVRDFALESSARDSKVRATGRSGTKGPRAFGSKGKALTARAR